MHRRDGLLFKLNVFFISDRYGPNWDASDDFSMPIPDTIPSFYAHTMDAQ